MSTSKLVRFVATVDVTCSNEVIWVIWLIFLSTIRQYECHLPSQRLDAGIQTAVLAFLPQMWSSGEQARYSRGETERMVTIVRAVIKIEKDDCKKVCTHANGNSRADNRRPSIRRDRIVETIQKGHRAMQTYSQRDRDCVFNLPGKWAIISKREKMTHWTV